MGALDKLKTFFSGASQPISSIANAGLSYLFSRRLMKQQNQYAIDAFNRENARQDYLMANAQSIQRDSLKNAGYSAADPNGTGFAPPSTNTMDTPSQTQFSVSDFGDPFAQVANIRSMREDIRAKELANEHLGLENKYLERKLEAEIGNTEAERNAKEFQNAINTEVRPILIETFTQTLSNLKNSGDLTQKQIDEATKNISILDEQLKQQAIVTKHYDEKVVTEIEAIRKHMIAELNNSKAALRNASANEKNAITQRLAYDLQKRITDLGEKGINVNPSIWQSVINMLTSGKADELIKGIIDSYHKVNAMLYPEEQPKSFTEIALKNGNYFQAANMLFLDLMMALFPTSE